MLDTLACPFRRKGRNRCSRVKRDEMINIPIGMTELVEGSLSQSNKHYED